MSVLHGQMDLFTGQTAAVEPAAAGPAHPGSAIAGRAGDRVERYGGNGDCDACWHEQAAAERASDPLPWRRRATWARRTAQGTMLLCEPHKIAHSAEKENTSR